MAHNVYVVKRRFKTLGNLFMEGHIFDETEYLNGDVVRRPKGKMNDGQVVPFYDGDINNEAKAARLEAYLGMTGLAEKILAAIAESDEVEEVVEEPIVEEAPKVEVKEKSLPKSVTPKITTKVAPKIVNKLNTNK